MKRVIYSILFNLPRAILDLMCSIITITTLGWFVPIFNYKYIYRHSVWADKVSNKFKK